MDMNIDPKERERDIGQWLESALGQYGKVEPRTGLESRLLANLRVERNRIASRRRWWWATGAATALAVIVAAVWVGEGDRERNPGSKAGVSTSASSSTMTHREAAPRPIEPRPALGATHAVTAAAKHGPTTRPLRDLAVGRTPKLAQFPSPRPLSEQEKILMSYVAQYPQTAALVAQDRAEALERDLEEEAADAATNSMQ
jgi:hypothetical protein